jgi:hypothetical protein
MLNIVLLGDCKDLFPTLSNYLLETPSVEVKISKYLHVSSTETMRCIYTEGYVDSRLIDYIRIARLVIIAHALPDRVSDYWIDLVKTHVPTLPILLVGLQSDEFSYPFEENPHHLTHLCLKGLDDPSVRDYIKERYGSTVQENYCCWPF